MAGKRADFLKRADTLVGSNDRRSFDLLGEVTGYALYLLDADGVIAAWNAGAELILGYKAGEVVGEPFSRLFDTDNRRKGMPRQALLAAQTTGRYESEGWQQRKDGNHLWASTAIEAIRGERQQLLGYACITRDATAKRAAEQALWESERQFRLLVAGVTDYALFMLDPNGIVSSWNAGAQRIKGYKAGEIIGQHFSRFFTDVDRGKGTPLRALYAATQEGRFEAEGWRVRKDGSLFWANAIIDAIRDEDGKLIGFAKITRDITERREAQLALQRSQEQLAHAQRMEALGLLTGGIAHDFNNLLMIVGGQAQMLKRRASDPKDLRALEAIELAAASGEKLTRQLLAFSRKQQLNPIVLDLRQRLRVSRELLASSIGSTVELEIDLADDLWLLEIDATEFELALVNLAVNARDAMPAGGKITVSARNTKLSGTIDPPLSGEFVAVAVSDTGTGIDPEVLPRIFEPFFTTKEVSKGTGLGLSQVYGFTHQSGGGVWAESAPGTGTTITMYLPRSQKPLSAATLKVDAKPADQAAGTVLVVEDNPEVAKVSAMLLEQIGYRVIVATNAEGALKELEGNGAIDLVFSDVVMPGEINGINLAILIRERYPQMPILLTSGYSNAAEAAEQQFPLLRKPYQISALASSLAAVRAQSRSKA